MIHSKLLLYEYDEIGHQRSLDDINSFLWASDELCMIDRLYLKPETGFRDGGAGAGVLPGKQVILTTKSFSENINGIANKLGRFSAEEPPVK